MIVGIDLGTTNSAVGVWRDGRAELIPNGLGHLLTPSAVSLDETVGGELLVGLVARERQVSAPTHTATAFKRYMGSDRLTQLGKLTFLPEELSALVLRRLKEDAEAYLGEEVTEAVITVPAYFNDKQRKATRRAGELAGLKVERLLNEPTAAALAYGIHEADSESRFLVFDLGGGTFDVSVLEMFDGVIEVRASTGDNRLGGEDFNEALAEGFVGRIPAVRDLARNEPAFRERLREAAERTRRVLTDRPSAAMTVTWEGEALQTEITSEDFEVLAAPLLARLKDPVLRALRDSGLRPDQLAEIILVGGATRMPIVRRTTTRMFGRFPSNAVHPDEAVAIGAAILAGLKTRDVALKEIVLTDVCPYSLGVETSEHSPGAGRTAGIFEPVIERNTVIPASRIKVFSTVDDNQQKVKLPIYQGESRRVADNIRLGELLVSVPPGPAGSVAIEVRFTYDVNGLLQVDVHVPETGERRELVIVDDEAMSAEEIKRRCDALAALKQHPRDNEANRHAMARAERCFETFLGDKREFVARCIREFEAALHSQDPHTVEHSRRNLIEALNALEGETWL